MSDFYEDDEPVEKIEQIWNDGFKIVTSAPPTHFAWNRQNHRFEPVWGND